MDLEKPITTQEDLDEIIAAKVAEAEKSIQEKFDDYDDLKSANEKYQTDLEALNKSMNENKQTFEASLAEANAKIKGYEQREIKIKVANEYGIPMEMIGRLNGDDEEAIRKDAESLSKFVKPQQQIPPLASTEQSAADSKQEALRNMLSQLNNQED